MQTHLICIGFAHAKPFVYNVGILRALHRFHICLCLEKPLVNTSNLYISIEYSALIFLYDKGITKSDGTVFALRVFVFAVLEITSSNAHNLQLPMVMAF